DREWGVGEPNRGGKSNGLANFSYGLTFEGQTAQIVMEDSSVIERRTEYMPSPGSRESIRRSVLKFHEIYQQSGMSGLSAEIKDCWQKLKPLPAENEIAYCFGLDYI